MVPFASADKVFDTPKPPRLIERMLRIATKPKEHDIVLDFFAGSGTTGEAVLQLNKGDQGNRKFILVQLPEKTDAEDYRTIAEMAKARIRNVVESLAADEDGTLPFDANCGQDRGFRVLTLSSSNFKIWDGEEAPKDADALAGQLKLFADHVMPDRGEQDILYELILKAGLPLTAKIEDKDVAGQTAYSIADGLLLICLANPITQETLRAMIALNPQRVVCLDPAFGGNDQLKTNTVLEMKSHNIEFRTV